MAVGQYTSGEEVVKVCFSRWEKHVRLLPHLPAHSLNTLQSNFKSVRRAAQESLGERRAEMIDGLMNIAGIMCLRYGKRKQGIEMQFGTVWLMRVLDDYCSASDVLNWNMWDHFIGPTCSLQPGSK